MLGNNIYQRLSKVPDLIITGIGRSKNPHKGLSSYIQGDLILPETLQKIGQKKYNIIINCAANVSVDRCEKEPVLAKKLHQSIIKNIAESNPDALFIQCSTDSIFDGKKGNYTEIDIPNPLNKYAETKLLGEFEVLKYFKKHYILRFNIYGFHLFSGNSLFEWAYKNLSKGLSINGFSNVIFNPLYTGQIADIIKILLRQPIPFGVFNLSGDNIISKYDFLISLADKMKFNKILIQESLLNPNDFTALRPLNTTLLNHKFKQYFPNFDLTFNYGLDCLVKDFTTTTSKNN